jgi:hypothetical protein
LSEAAETESSVAVGDRLIDETTNASVGDLAPGAAAPFTLQVPVSSLPVSRAPGVYWIGVHALGTSPDGRDVVADGRARTFIPLVTEQQARRQSAEVSVVLPLRERVRRAPDGSLADPVRWGRLTGADGRLTQLVEFAASAGTTALTWVADPAVLDALEDYGRGNPALSLGPAEAPPGDEDTEPSDGPGDPGDETPSESASATPDARPDAPSDTQRNRANAVLETFLARAADDTVLSLGYADPDVVSLARRRPSLLNRADDLAGRRMQARGLDATPAVAPPDGLFDPDLLADLSQGSLVLLSDEGRLEDPPASRLPSGQELVLSDERASAGGPSPTRALDPLALRQRILSESALALDEEPNRPIVVRLPGGWNPGPRWREADFFGGLATAPWLRMTSLPRGATSTYDGELTYGGAELADEVSEANVSATRTLVRTGDTLGHLLANESSVADRLAGAALSASSYSARRTPRLAGEQVLALDAATRAEMDRVQVTGNEFVVLAGGSGTLTVTLVNGLEQPITVGLRARTAPDVRLQIPEPVNMGPGQRATMRIPVVSQAGVRDITLYPVTTSNEDAGQPLTFSLRTSEVGRLIWYIVIAGGALLAVMIVRRIVLRIRNHRWRES